MDEFADRVLVAVGDIAEAHPGQRVLVVTHGWVMDAIARHAAGLPRHAVLHGKPKNGETSWVQVRQRTILAANA
jgi:broad specificity phosphatase PhoE